MIFEKQHLLSIDSLKKLHQTYNVLYAVDECGRRLDYDINLMWSDNKFHQAYHKFCLLNTIFQCSISHFLFC